MIRSKNVYGRAVNIISLGSALSATGFGAVGGPGPHDSSLNEVSCGDLEEAVTKPMLQSQIDLRS
jgi:hypothetical protein